MKLKTSTRISLKFTIFTASILLVLGIFLNLFFFGSWYGLQQNRLMNQGFMERVRPNWLPPMGPRDFPQEVLIEDELAKRIVKGKQLVNIAQVDNERVSFTKKNGKITFMPIENQMDMQIMLLQVSLWLFIIFSALSYGISLIFVKTSLKSLKRLVEFVQGLNPDQLNKKITLPGPQNDELKIVAESINDFLQKIHQHTQALKDFVSNASHEIKTPLMSISTSLDYMIKAKSYESGLGNIKASIKHINELLEQLLLIAKLDAYENIKMEDSNISKIAINTLDIIQEIYQTKELNFVSHIQKNIILPVLPAGFTSIIKNLLDNAAKYTLKGGTITITLDQKKLEIQDTGVGIAPQSLPHIRERFWRVDSARSGHGGFGLGLYLVKKFVDAHGRKIHVKSQVNEGSSFVIYFS